MTKTYQWTRGEKQGNVVKTIGETFIEDNIEYMVFTDGSMVNTSLINDFLIEIPSESEAMLMQDLAPQPLRRVEQKPKEMPRPQVAEVSPLEKLLTDCKKSPATFDVTVNINMPSIDLMKVLADSYEDGEDQVLKFLASSIQMEEVRNQIAEVMKHKVFKKNPKSKENERVQDPT